MSEPANRRWPGALFNGFRRKCPACGEGKLFASYISVRARCDICGQDLHHQRADDAPPYFSIFIAGHIVVPLLLITEKRWAPPLWLHFSIWLPLTALLVIWLLPRVKGATIGLQWAFGMHGFGTEQESSQEGRKT